MFSLLVKAVDPENKQRHGDVVRYGDVVLLVDDRDYVWTDNVSAAPVTSLTRTRIACSLQYSSVRQIARLSFA